MRPHPRPDLRQASFALWLANVAFGCAIGAGLLEHVRHAPSPRTWVYAVAALVSTVASLSLVPGLFGLFAARWKRARFALAAQAAVWIVFQVLLFADVRVYNLHGYHLNGQVWDIFVTRGSADAIHLGWRVHLAIGAGLFLGGCVEYALGRWLYERASHSAQSRPRPALLARHPGLVFALLLAPAFALERGIYASARSERDHDLTSLARLFPYAPGVPLEDFASRVLGSQPAATPPLELDGLELDYPHAVPRIDPAGARPDVLVLVVDCWRSDMLAPETSPRLHAFAQRARRFEDHVSGGNSTRYGLFALLYGLHGSYWFPVLAEQRSPVLIDALLELGYECAVFSAASMNYPELRSTAWSRIREHVHDAWGELPAWRRDELAAEACADWLERPRTGAPRFAFLLLDSPHQVYSHPPDRAPFQPAAPELNYMALSAGAQTDPELLEQVFNRYRNAVHHADSVAGALLGRLESAGALEHALVAVTGDHGEEFREHGFFGHTSNFTPEQVRVPFLLRGAGVEPGLERSPTSHLDFPSTLLELLGADPAERAAWCLGGNLLAPERERERVLSGWHELGLWLPEGILRLQLQAPASFAMQLHGYDWSPRGRGEELLETRSDALARLAAECGRFLR